MIVSDNSVTEAPGMTYNTMLPKLSLPEYGRNIQQMVDRCLAIANRDERTRCAHSIVRTMISLNPSVREQEGWEQKLWDHLALMSDYKLDIDWPVNPPHPEHRGAKPDKILYPSITSTWRNYGRSIQRMVARACLMPLGPERDALVFLIANQMKKLMLGINKDYVDDRRIFKDLAAMSHGEINLNPEEIKLCHFHILPVSKKKRKK